MPTKRKKVAKMSAKKNPSNPPLEINCARDVLKLKPLADHRGTKKILEDSIKARKAHRQLILTRGKAHQTFRSNKRLIK